GASPEPVDLVAKLGDVGGEPRSPDVHVVALPLGGGPLHHVDRLERGRDKEPDGGEWVLAVQPDVPGEVVPGTGGNDGQGTLRSDDAVCAGPDLPIPAEGRHDPVAGRGGPPRPPLGAVRVLRD